MIIYPILTYAELKSINPFINNDIDNDLLNTMSVNVQNTLLRDTLGYAYYDSIYNQFLSGGTTGFTAADQIIFDNYLQYIITWGVTRDINFPLMYQLNSDGLRVVTSSHSEAATDKAATVNQAYWQNLINERRVEMGKYIRDNSLDYPLYVNKGRKKFINEFQVHGIKRNNCNWWGWNRI